MFFKFRKKIRIAPGIAFNLNKALSPSITLGSPGLGISINEDGVAGFAAVTGTGLGIQTARHKPHAAAKTRRIAPGHYVYQGQNIQRNGAGLWVMNGRGYKTLKDAKASV